MKVCQVLHLLRNSDANNLSLSGHRLKSSDSKTTKMFEVLNVPRRIILSGTPVQNNLGEFHAMVGIDPRPLARCVDALPAIRLIFVI